MYIEVNIGCKISWQVLFCQRGSCIFEFSLLDFVKKYSIILKYFNIESSVHVHDLCKLFYLSYIEMSAYNMLVLTDILHRLSQSTQCCTSD